MARDYVRGPLSLVVAVAAGSLGILLVTTTARGSPDDLGRTGRWLVQQCGGGTTESRGPWPGSFYSLPLAMLVVAGSAAANFALKPRHEVR